MTSKKHPPEQRDDRTEVDDGESQDSAVPVKRFKSLAKRLINVSREELEEQQRQYDADKRERRKDKG
jgi:hypothetical protein